MTDLNTPSTRNPRRIGRIGALARFVLGVTLLAVAISGLETTATHWVVGLLGLPLVTLVAIAALRRGRPDAQWTGPEGHLANTLLAVLMFVTSPQVAFVFYGAAMLLAAARGYAGCELLAFSNAVLRRNDEIGCPVFSPIDQIEARSTAR